MEGMAQSESSMVGLSSGASGISVTPKKSTHYLSLASEIIAVAAVYFAAALLALSVGYALAPTYLENARGFSSISR